MAKRIYVGNLPFSCTPDQLRQLFSAYGEVVSATLVNDRQTGQPRGFGFVEMGDQDALAAISALDQQSFGGRTLRVNEAQPREERGPRRRESA